MSESSEDRRPGPRPAGSLLTEDWAATVVGLLLLVLTLTGVIPTGLVP